MIDDRVIAAKELYASQMGFENQMRYEMVKATEINQLLVKAPKKLLHFSLKNLIFKKV